MRFVALIGHGPEWIRGRSVYEQGPPIHRHLEAMPARYDEGSLLLGGPFANDGGGIAVLEVPDEEAANELMKADPAVQAGVLVFDVQPLRAYFDAFAGVRTEITVDELSRDALLGARRSDPTVR